MSLETLFRAQVRLRYPGPEDVLKTVEAAEVSLDLGHISGSVSVTGNIVLVGKDGEEITNPYLKLQTSSVQVSVPVYIRKRFR